jgi:adenosylhomocysteine nucleosidase
MKILFVAAEAMEFRGMARRLSDIQPAPVPVGWARTGKLRGQDVLLVANGAGWKRASAATRAGIDHFSPDAVVSTGYCGALDGKMNIADVVVATEIRVGQAFSPANRRCAGEIACLAIQHPGQYHTGPIFSIDHVAQSAEEKKRLRCSGACAVEMEAAGVAECAQVWGRPFYCVRAVTDLAGENMTNDFNTALRSDGHFDTMLIFRGVLRHPSARIAELVRLGFRCARASRSLGDFFADCGF